MPADPTLPLPRLQRLRRLPEQGLPQRLAAPPHQQRGHARQQALIDAGLRLTATRDWADVTVADIAAAIGCSVGTFYTRFHSKDTYFEVLVGLVADVLTERSEAFHADPLRRSETAGQFIASWVELVVRSFCIHRGLYAAAVLDVRRRRSSAPAAVDAGGPETLPLPRLRQRSVALLQAAMARYPGWRTAAARRRLAFAHQVVQGVLINAVLTDPGPLRLDEPALVNELAAVLRAYLQIDDTA